MVEIGPGVRLLRWAWEINSTAAFRSFLALLFEIMTMKDPSLGVDRCAREVQSVERQSSRILIIT